tara:strand:- start:651 stop:1022 length:372 start_codon:yes stop_codon:yes gene_type:complete
MSDRLIQLRDNQRRVTRGISWNSQRSRYELDIEEGETLKLTVSLAGILASGESISSATIESQGISTSISTSSPEITVTFSGLSGTGISTLTITRSGGQIHKLRIRTRSANSTSYYDYYTGVPS